MYYQQNLDAEADSCSKFLTNSMSLSTIINKKELSTTTSGSITYKETKQNYYNSFSKLNKRLFGIHLEFEKCFPYISKM